MSAKALKIYARERVFEFIEVETDENGFIELETLQGAVHGTIEHVSIDRPECDGIDMWINEEGKLNGLPLNQMATDLSAIWRRGDFIVGDALVCAFNENGDAVGLSDAQEKTLRRALSR